MQGIAYSYVRFSTPEQSRGDSIRRQLDSTRRYCEEHRLALDESLTMRDEGVSAFKSKNRTKGSLAKFLSAIESGRIKSGATLIVESFDRLSRDEILTALNLFTQIIQGGIKIVTLMDNRTYTRESVNSNPTDLMFSIMVMARAHEESSVKSKRVREAKDRRRKTILAGNSKAFGGRCPGWIKIADGRFELIPERVDTVRKIVRMGLDGMGAGTIARRLNEDHTKTWSNIAKKRGWTTPTVKYLMGSRTLIGEFESHTSIDGKIIKAGTAAAYYPAVIDEATYYRLQSAMATRMTTTKRGSTGKGIANLFGDLLVSAIDGSRMMIVQKETAQLVSLDGMEHRAKYSLFPLAAFEKSFLAWVSEVQIEPSAGPEANRLEEIAGRMAELKVKIDLLDKQLEAASADQFPQLVELMKRLSVQNEKLAIEKVEASTAANAMTFSTKDIRKLVMGMDKLSAAERESVRAKLRLAIGSVVKQIKLFIDRRGLTSIGIVDVTLDNGQQRVFGILVKRGGIVVTLSAGHAATVANFSPAVIAKAVLDVAAPLPSTAFVGDDTPAIKEIRKAFAAGYVASVTKKK